MARRSHRKGHGTGVKDYRTMAELEALLPRESLAPGKTPTSTFRSWQGVAGSYGQDVIDDRTPEERAAQNAWDARFAEIKKGNDKRANERRASRIDRARQIATGQATVTPVEDDSKKPAEEPVSEAAGTPAAAPVSNGRAKAPGTPAAPAPVSPRKAPPADVSATSKFGRASNVDSGLRVNGAPVDIGDTATRNQVKAAQKEAAMAEAIDAAEARRDAQSRAKHGDRRRVQDEREESERLDARLEAYRQRMEAKRQEKEAARRDKRYASRTLSNRDDWENLGRAGSDSVDYSDEKNAEAKKARDKRVSALQDRLAKMGDKTLVGKDETATWKDGRMVVTDAKGNEVKRTGPRTTTGVGNDGQRYANDFYAYDPGKQKHLEGLRKLVEAGIENGTLTDAQIEGATKTLDRWEQGAKDRKEAQDARNAQRDAMRTNELRAKYGMEDREIYDDEMVKKYHRDIQAERRKGILGKMAAGGEAASAGKYGDAWNQLIDAGFDPKATLKAALNDPEVARGYNDAWKKIDLDDTLSKEDREEMRDQLKHRTMMNQAFKTAGIEGQAVDIGAIRAQKLVSDAEAEAADIVPSEKPAESGYQLPTSNSDLEEPENGDPAAVLKPRSPQPAAPGDAELVPKKKKNNVEGAVTASRGGSAMPFLRPRRRA